MNVGYTTGVFDLFHVGHLWRLSRAKTYCDYLIVGVSTDACVRSYKHREPIISFEQRLEVIRALKFVDEAVAQETLDKYDAWTHHHFNTLIIGNDESQWSAVGPFVERLTEVGVRIISDSRYVGVSTTEIIARIRQLF